MHSLATLARSVKFTQEDARSVARALRARACQTLTVAWLLACLVGLARPATAQAGSNDPSFSPEANGTYGDGANGPVYAIATEPDGKVLIGGGFTFCNGVPRRGIARLNVDGSLDPSLNPGTGPTGSVYTLARQSDGKVMIGGDFVTYGGVLRIRVARVNADGSLDTSFDPGAGPNGPVHALAVQPDGKVLLVGGFSAYQGAVHRNIVRINADGSADTSFVTNGGVRGFGAQIVWSMALQADGKILIGGDFTSVNGTTRQGIARLNSNGSLDASFNPGAGILATGAAAPTVYAITVQPDGKVLIGGSFGSYNHVTRNHLARLNPNGALDTSFNPGAGPMANGNPDAASVRTFAVQPDGKLLIGGMFTTYDNTQRNNLARVNSDGSLDASYGPAAGANAMLRAFSLQSDDKLLIGGDLTSYAGATRSGITRLNLDGSLDAGFNPGSGPNAAVSAVALQTDSKLVIAGEFTTFSGTAIQRVARLHADGALDTSFSPGSGPNKSVSALALQSDGKLLIGGRFVAYDDTDIARIARINSDGSLDASFNPGLGANAEVRAIAVQPDGKVLIGGTFTQLNGASRPRVARLNADGSVDASFDPGTGPTAGTLSVDALAVQPDGRVLIVGSFGLYNGTPRGCVARLNADGSLDTSFDPGSGADLPGSNIHPVLLDVALRSDGKVLIGGDFTTYNGTERYRVALLNADGSLDTSFSTGFGANSAVNALALQPDGKLLIGGNFTSYNHTTRNRVARLNADGSLDVSFDPGAGANLGVTGFALQPDGKLLIGGTFTSYAGAPRHRVARVFTIAPGVATNYCTSGTSAIGCTPTMSAAGAASAAATSGYFVTTSNIEGQRQTNTFYSLLGAKTPPTPFGAGFLCVKAPTQRIGSVQASGTSSMCDGTVSIDVLAWAQTHPSGEGAPYTAGMTLDFQCAIRDPLSPGTRVMSDALQVTLLP